MLHENATARTRRRRLITEDREYRKIYTGIYQGYIISLKVISLKRETIRRLRSSQDLLVFTFYTLRTKFLITGAEF